MRSRLASRQLSRKIELRNRKPRARRMRITVGDFFQQAAASMRRNADEQHFRGFACLYGAAPAAQGNHNLIGIASPGCFCIDPSAFACILDAARQVLLRLKRPHPWDLSNMV